MPTLEDNWSLVVPEAMACGLPVLCSVYKGCHPELIVEGRNGWTFDPLQARNAQRNLRRLGAQATGFLENVYGMTSSALHYGLPPDRLLVRWELRSPRVEQRLAGGEPPRSEPTPDLPRINDVRWQAGWPVSSDPALDLAGPALLLEIPPEFEVLSQAAPHVAADWHDKVRRALAAYFGRGYVASDLVPTDEAVRRRPVYLLTG